MTISVSMEQKKTQKKIRKPSRRKQIDRFEIKEVIGKKGSTWLVTGYKLDGSRVRKKFKTRVQADTEVHALSLQSADRGLRTVATKLSEEQLEDAQAANGLLREGETLVSAVEFYKANYKRVSGLPLNEAIFMFVESKERNKKSQRTINQLKYTCNSFAEFVEDKPVDEVLKADAKAFLSKFSPQTFNNYRAELHNLFNWCQEENLCASNPLKGIERIEIKRDKVFLEPNEVEALLASAKANESGDLLPFVAIALFAGLRPDSELKKLTWDRINFEDEEIQVPAGKTGVKRTVKMRPNLVEFLQEADRTKPIYPKNFRRKFSVVRRSAGFKGGITNSKAEAALEADPRLKKWVPDVTRHSFITYYVRDCRDVYITATMAGNSPEIIRAHYEGAASSSQANKYWSITPKTLEADNLLKFA